MGHGHLGKNSKLLRKPSSSEVFLIGFQDGSRKMERISLRLKHVSQKSKVRYEHLRVHSLRKLMISSKSSRQGMELSKGKIGQISQLSQKSKQQFSQHMVEVFHKSLSY
jgi:hypothetical protein